MATKQTLAVDIGNKNIKIVLGRYSGNNLEIMDYKIVPTPANAIHDGKISNPDAIVAVIGDFLLKHKKGKKELIMTVTGTGVITRDITLPKSTEEEIEKILEFEAQQYFPVDLEHYVLDFKVIEEVIQNDVLSDRIFLVAVPEKQLEEYVLIHKLLKIPLLAVDIPANCITKLIAEGFIDVAEKTELQAKTEGYAVVDIGSDTTSVCIYFQNKQQFNRILMNGSKDIDQMLSQSIGIDGMKAEQIKKKTCIQRNTILENEPVEEFSDTDAIIRSAVENMAHDLGRFIEFYTSRNNNNKIWNLILCGGGSLLGGLDHLFSTYFSIPVIQIKPTNKIIFMDRKREKEFEKDFGLLINALGALIRKKEQKPFLKGLKHLQLSKRFRSKGKTNISHVNRNKTQ